MDRLSDSPLELVVLVISWAVTPHLVVADCLYFLYMTHPPLPVSIVAISFSVVQWPQSGNQFLRVEHISMVLLILTLRVLTCPNKLWLVARGTNVWIILCHFFSRTCFSFWPFWSIGNGSFMGRCNICHLHAIHRCLSFWFFMNGDSLFKWENGCCILVKLEIEVCPSWYFRVDCFLSEKV